MSEQTITVEEWHGKKKAITREDFVSRWTSELGSLYALTESEAEINQVMAMRESVRAMANRRFDKLLAQEVKA